MRIVCGHYSGQFVFGAAEEGSHGADYQADHEHDDDNEDCG